MKTHRSDTHLVSRDDVLVLLEDGPKGTGKLAEWTGHPTPRLDAALKQMLREGLVTRVGTDKRWALAGYIPAPHPTPAHNVKSAAPAKTGKPSSSWWLGLSREAFAAGVKDRDAARQRNQPVYLKPRPQ